MALPGSVLQGGTGTAVGFRAWKDHGSQAETDPEGALRVHTPAPHTLLPKPCTPELSALCSLTVLPLGCRVNLCSQTSLGQAPISLLPGASLQTPSPGGDMVRVLWVGLEHPVPQHEECGILVQFLWIVLIKAF